MPGGATVQVDNDIIVDDQMVQDRQNIAGGEGEETQSSAHIG